MKIRSVFPVTLLLILLVFQDSRLVLAATEEDVERSIDSAERKMLDCYEDVAEADEAGANATDLLALLEESGWLLSRANLAYRKGDFNASLDLATKSLNVLESLMNQSRVLREEALESSYLDFMIGFVGSLAGGIVVGVGAVIIWFWLKRRYDTKKVEKYGLFFVLVLGVLALMVASSGLSRLLVYPRTEFFTEFWALDSDGRAENYPFNVSSEKEYKVILGIGNQLGYCGYYLVEVKFRNENMSAPDSFNFTPSSLPSIMNISAFVADEEIWELPLEFTLGYRFNESVSQVEVDSLTLNEVKSPVKDYMLNRDEEKQGYFSDLIFELWAFNGTAGKFEYHRRFLRLKLNLTVP